MPDRTINWGDPADAGTKYRTQDDDPAGGGNFVVAEDTDNNTVLLQYNPTASQWEYAGPVDMGSNDISNVGTISANALEAGKANIKNVAGKLVWDDTNNQTVPNSTVTQIEFDSVEINSSIVNVDTALNSIEVLESGKYTIKFAIFFQESTNWSNGDLVQMRYNINGSNILKDRLKKTSTGDETFKSSVVKTLSTNDTITVSTLQNSGSDQILEKSFDAGDGIGRLEVVRHG